MSTLPAALRRQLENAIKQARTIAEGGARKALEALAVHEPDPYKHMDKAQRAHRKKLQAQANQLGDSESRTRPGAYEIKHLVEKLAYDQWHRLLFARFLLENNLLISPEHGVSVSLDDCEELAPSLGLKDAWAVAACFAAKELPQIFRADDPAGAVDLPVEDRKPLIQLVTGLPVMVFTATDSLGWCYQFWQADKKEEVNAAGNKIGADELPAVTQLFTEDYMVDFLLDNTLGAWHAGKVLASTKLAETAQNEDELRRALSLPGCPWNYLRFIKDQDGKWTPAAGIFDGWPKTAQELTCLDPCMGSGHFVVAMFERLVVLRMLEEKLDEMAAVAAVIRDNLFGLELDPRCTQIGAFNLALAAWRRVGHCTLPAMNLACSGLAPNAKNEDWLKLAGDNEKLQNGIERLYQLFKDAPVLGSLINPRATEGNLLVAAFHELQPLLEKALAQEAKDDAAHEMAVTASGLAKAAEILAGQFTLAATNVPYLAGDKQSAILSEFCESAFPTSKRNLAYVFMERMIAALVPVGTIATVGPQNWLFQPAYPDLRKVFLGNSDWNLVARLGTKAFQTPMWDLNVMLFIASKARPTSESRIPSINAEGNRSAEEKKACLASFPIKVSNQLEQLKNPDHIVLEELRDQNKLFLGDMAATAQGLVTGDDNKFVRRFWEVYSVTHEWKWLHLPPRETVLCAGRVSIILWEDARGDLHKRSKAHNFPPPSLLGKPGVAVQRMNLNATLYDGDVFGDHVAPLIPNDPKLILPLWCFCESPTFTKELRRVDSALKASVGSFLKIPFDLAHWQKVAAEKYPHGLPKPFSSDPTQWLFNGQPKGSDQPLQVAVARLLGYQWPRQTGSSFPDCPALGPDGLEKLADDDGIVCLSATKGEAPAAERLRAFLARAYAKEWNATKQEELLAQVDYAGATLEDWLRNGFFEQHCALFHHRPFIWHIWDGHKNGFSALVNYHRLTHANLEKLTYAYLGDWIRRQQAAVEAGEAGSDARREAAKQLQVRLKLILEGEPPYDLFVRWKPLSKQAIGWHPDLNDGVRMNIRPFAAADILRKRVKIKWEKDRGKEPVRDKKEFPWFWGWDEQKQDFSGIGKEPDGNRWNDCHYTNEFKKIVREANKAR